MPLLGLNDISQVAIKLYINGASSTKRPLSCGVPQGSVHGHLEAFQDVHISLGRDTKHHGIPYHFYADDGQLYIVFDLPTDDNPHTLVIATKKIEVCINEMRLWLAIHILLCNDGKTELMLFASHHKEPTDIPRLQIGSEEIIPCQTSRNIGLMMDTGLTFSTHVSNVVSAIFSISRTLQASMTTLLIMQLKPLSMLMSQIN